MNKVSNYLDFLKQKGRPLSEINPGSDEYALKVDDALQAIKLLQDTQSPILGGDILSDNVDKLIYAHQLWGSEYHCLNWSCEKYDTESQKDYSTRSYNIARNSINAANEIAKHLGKNCYVVIVI